MFGETLQQFREKAGLSQTELAQRVGVPVDTLQYWEVGTDGPGPEAVDRLAWWLGVPKQELEAELADDRKIAVAGDAVDVAYEKP